MTVNADPKDAKIIYISTRQVGVLKSSDGGTTWKEVNAGLAAVEVHGLAIDPNSPAKLHAAVREKRPGIYRTNDGAVKWTRVDDGPGAEINFLQSVNLPSGMGGIFLYAGISKGLQRTADCF
jgi:hypothetical protein